jgi:hypothetical protein
MILTKPILSCLGLYLSGTILLKNYGKLDRIKRSRLILSLVVPNAEIFATCNAAVYFCLFLC